jgi:hypothetical protein
MEAPEGVKNCGAKTRAGTPCKRQPTPGRTRCKLHGGASLAGFASPRRTHGLYSKNWFVRSLAVADLLHAAGLPNEPAQSMATIGLAQRLACFSPRRLLRRLAPLLADPKPRTRSEITVVLFDLLCPPEVQERLAAQWATHLRRLRRLGFELSEEDRDWLAAHQAARRAWERGAKERAAGRSGRRGKQADKRRKG